MPIREIQPSFPGSASRPSLQQISAEGPSQSGDQCYETLCHLSHVAREELEWWISQFSMWNGKSLVLRQPDHQIESDASLTGRVPGTLTGEQWSKQKCLHINCLELLAASTAAKDKRILLLLDSQTAVSYVNNLGGTVSGQATAMARELWMWCLQKDILLTAQHLPGVENVRADTESRVMRDRSDWMLNPWVFQGNTSHIWTSICLQPD